MQAANEFTIRKPNTKAPPLRPRGRPYLDVRPVQFRLTAADVAALEDIRAAHCDGTRSAALRRAIAAAHAVLVPARRTV